MARNIYTFALSLAVSLALVLAMATPGRAQLTVICPTCSNIFTQIMERITNLEQLKNAIAAYKENVEQTRQQIALVQSNIQQYQNMVQNTVNLPGNLLNEIKGEFSKLAQLTSQLQVQKGDYLAMGQVFDQTYPDLNLLETIARGSGAKSVKDIWSTWSKETDRAAEAAFKVTGGQLKDLTDDSDALDRHISNLLSTPEGQMQAMQSGNSLAAIQIDELRKLRAMMAVNIQAVTQSMMKAEKREQLSVEQREFLLDATGLDSQFQGYR